jgi:N-acetylmuramoyl-L-alanine amidase
MARTHWLSIFVLILFSTGCSRPASQHRILSYQETPEQRLSAILVQRPKIVIDAGHGGKDLGALSKTTPPAQEKNLNLTTALMLNSFLQKMGYQTILTRGDDFFVPLDLRSNIANSNHAALFVSVHYNSAPSLNAEGVEVFYFDSQENKKRTEESKILANKVLDRVVESTECKSRGVKHGNFAVIRETTMPAVLIEGGFVTNQNEMSKLKSPGYLKTLAGGIALGINDFLKSKIGKSE